MPSEISSVTYDFSDKVVLITGAARGQGRSHALAFAKAGAAVVVSDVAAPLAGVPYGLGDQTELDSVSAEVEALGARCLSFTCDVRDDSRVRAMVDATEAELGQIDVLVNNAGVGSVNRIEEMPDESWQAVVDTNLGGAMRCSRAVAKGMIGRRRGKIVNNGSISSFVGLPHNSHYTAAKHGLLGLTRALAVELAPHRINVNIVCPGAVATAMASGMSAANPDWIDHIAPVSGAWNLFDPAEMIESEDVTQAVLWLASDAAAKVTGVALPVDAGFLAK